MHIPDSDKCNWLRARIETAERQEYSQEEKLRILDRRVYSLLFVWKTMNAVGVAVSRREEELCILDR